MSCLLSCYCIQFYASKKRKSRSPSVKSGRAEKDAKITVEVSPSAKCTLDNYLKNSQDDGHTSKQSLLSRHEVVKRNLSLEIDKYSKDEKNQALLSDQAQPQATQKVISRCSSKEGNSEVGCHMKDGSAHIPESLELKQFATDFLSLYCRYCTSKIWMTCYKLLIFLLLVNFFGVELAFLYLLSQKKRNYFMKNVNPAFYIVKFIQVQVHHQRQR